MANFTYGDSSRTGDDKETTVLLIDWSLPLGAVVPQLISVYD
jgi:hypothetical protein